MRLMGRRQTGEGDLTVAAPPLGLGDVGTNFSRLPALLQWPVLASIVMVMSSSFTAMLTTVGSGDSHLGIVIIESAGGGFTTDTVIASVGASSLREGGGGRMP